MLAVRFAAYYFGSMRLKDLVHRSALRNRAAGDVEVDGGSAQVFEVTNLLIPSGTDWSGVGHPLGTIDLPSSWGSYVAYKLFIEVDAPIVAPDELMLSVDDDPDFSQSNTLARNRMEAGSRWRVITPFENEAGDLLLALTTGNAINGAGVTHALPTLPDTLYVGLHTSAATAADITVVSARAAFLLI